MADGLSDGTSWAQAWKCEEQETVRSRCRSWNVAGKTKLWSAVGIIYLQELLGLGVGLVRVRSWGCDNHWDLLETFDVLGLGGSQMYERNSSHLSGSTL